MNRDCSELHPHFVVVFTKFHMTSVSTISIYYDNERYIKIAKNLTHHSKTKHFVAHLKYIHINLQKLEELKGHLHLVYKITKYQHTHKSFGKKKSYAMQGPNGNGNLKAMQNVQIRLMKGPTFQVVLFLLYEGV